MVTGLFGLKSALSAKNFAWNSAPLPPRARIVYPSRRVWELYTPPISGDWNSVPLPLEVTGTLYPSLGTLYPSHPSK